MELSDLFGETDFDSIDRKIEFERTLEDLKARDKRVVALYAGGHTYDEIGELMGLTKGRVCQILSEIKQRLS